jgi:uncharacterized sporulation protein YeaH/YhbH (DUF444 family)
MTGESRFLSSSPWYELFSRGSRDWLRHNEKVREAVRGQIMDLVASDDFMSDSAERTVQVPVRLLEHARFRLAEGHTQKGAGQGDAKAGDELRPAQPGSGEQGEEGEGGRGDGGFKLLLEFKVDDIVDWLMEELELPDLKPVASSVVEDDTIVREGTGRRGIRARLDRRRTVKEAVKRRAIQSDPKPFVDDDLRFHQLKARPRVASNAVVIFALDVSASMSTAERKLAKTFFFFALAGLRRRYRRIDVRFIAHTTEAWEFAEGAFFEVTGSGGTEASCAFQLARKLLDEHYDAASYNAYLFYASDGENAVEDRDPAFAALTALAERLNHFGYLETRPPSTRFGHTQMRGIVADLRANGMAANEEVVAEVKDVWRAIRHFFVREAQSLSPP